MEDNLTLEEVSAAPFVPTPLEPNELFRSQGWSVYLENQGYFLAYLSGHLADFEKRIPITQDEAERLIAGRIDADEVLLSYGAN